MIESARALFLDRDGVINVNHGYVHRQADVDFIDGIFDLVALAKRAGYLVLVVTNQAGIGRGYYTEADFHVLMDWMCRQFAERGGAIDKVYFCPDHPENGIGQYKRDIGRRKPDPGMLLEAAREWRLSLADSVLVGDKQSDIQAGLAAGVGCNILLASDLGAPPGFAGGPVVRHLEEAGRYLTRLPQIGS